MRLSVPPAVDCSLNSFKPGFHQNRVNLINRDIIPIGLTKQVKLIVDQPLRCANLFGVHVRSFSYALFYVNNYFQKSLDKVLELWYYDFSTMKLNLKCDSHKQYKAKRDSACKACHILWLLKNIGIVTVEYSTKFGFQSLVVVKK